MYLAYALHATVNVAPPAIGGALVTWLLTGLWWQPLVGAMAGLFGFFVWAYVTARGWSK